MKRTILILGIIASGCSADKEGPDAYGNFEATEISVAAEQPGKVVRLDLEEGQALEKGEVTGLIDTTMLHLQKKQLQIKGKVLEARFPGIASELAVLREQKGNLMRELDRFRNLAEKGAAPEKHADDLKDQIAVLEKRIKAVETQNQPLVQELALIDAQVEQFEEQIRDAIIKAPASGTVLLKMAEAGEMVTAGTPLYRIADLDHLILRAYISGRQLDDITIGQQVKVLTDKDEETYREHSGKITWVSDEAEFTPKIIQTKEDRTDLVYAVKIKVPNDGTLKIGMPAEVIFTGRKPAGND